MIWQFLTSKIRTYQDYSNFVDKDTPHSKWIIILLKLENKLLEGCPSQKKYECQKIISLKLLFISPEASNKINKPSQNLKLQPFILI